MPNKINLTGTDGKTYNLDDIAENSRENSSDALIVQVWKWNPNLPETNPHKYPNPNNLKIGQIWLSKLVEYNSEEYKALLNGQEQEG